MSELLESEARTGFWDVPRNRRAAFKFGAGALLIAAGAGMGTAEQHDSTQDCQSPQHDEAFNSPFGSSPDNPANKAYQEDVCAVPTPPSEEAPTPDSLTQR